MRVLMWVLRGVMFLLLLGFALKNTAPVSVVFYFGTTWNAPLIIVALAFFAVGMAFGVLALLGTVFRLRRALARERMRTTSGGAGASEKVAYNDGFSRI